MLFVRANEDDNNHYLQTLKNSGIWDVFCGEETYQQISEYSGFNLAGWIQDNIDWSSDLSDDTIQYFRDNDLEKYLIFRCALEEGARASCRTTPRRFGGGGGRGPATVRMIQLPLQF